MQTESFQLLGDKGKSRRVTTLDLILAIREVSAQVEVMGKIIEYK